MSASPERRRFAVTWRDSGHKQTVVVAVLTYDGSYRFRYTSAARDVDLQPFGNFPDLDGDYVSPFLFPFFVSRVMDRRRPDFAAWQAALGLPPDADDLDLLGRSGGWRQGDRAGVVEVPRVASDGATSHAFLVRGLAHLEPDPARRDALLRDVTRGDALTLRRDDQNDVDPEALLIAHRHSALGWVPAVLIDYVGTVVEAGGALTVLRCNGPEQPPYLRLVVQVEGSFPPDRVPLSGLTEDVGAVL